MNRVPPSNTGPRINFDRRWTYEVAYFTQYIGAILRDLGNFLNTRDYVEARLLAAQMKKRAEYEKTIRLNSRHRITSQRLASYSTAFWMSAFTLPSF
jgi:hypothetical protein